MSEREREADATSARRPHLDQRATNSAGLSRLRSGPDGIPSPMPAYMPSPLSARAAAAQFDLAAILQMPTQDSGNQPLGIPKNRVAANSSVQPAKSDGGKMERNSKAKASADAGRLPSAWYKQADEIAEASRQERRALVIRASAAACVVTGAGLLFWLGAFGARVPVEQPMLVTSYAPAPRPAVLAAVAPTERPMPVASQPNARALVTTAQILEVAERFVAVGDILAARAMLSETAEAGDPNALFALAETYDPNLLASWNASNVEASPAYARVLYEAALRAGMRDAGIRLDALK